MTVAKPLPLEALERLKELAGREGLNYIANEQGDIIWPADLRSLLSSYEAQGERLREVEGVLEPFAKAAGKLDGKWSDDDWRWNDSVRSAVTVGHIRKALRALTQPPAMDGGQP